MATRGIGDLGARARALHCAFRLRAAAPSGGGGGKKKSKAGAAAAPVGPTLPVEVRAKATLGANIQKEGTDPAIKDDSEYPPWLFDILKPLPALSELKRKPVKTLPLKDLKRLVRLDNRRRIKEKNELKAK